MVSPQNFSYFDAIRRDKACLVSLSQETRGKPHLDPKIRIPPSVQKCSLLAWIRWTPHYRPYPKAKHYLARSSTNRYEI